MRPLPRSLTPLLYQMGGDISGKKLMAGEMKEKNRDTLFDSNFLAFTDIDRVVSESDEEVGFEDGWLIS